MWSKKIDWTEEFGSYSSILHFCSYQERSQQETRQKLFTLGANKEEVENVIAELVSRDYINEERFCRSYCRGKFRMKQWGKIKIRQHLSLHKISDYCLKKGMEEIEDEEYVNTLRKISEKKWIELKGEGILKNRQHKLYRYLQTKGYETDLIKEFIPQSR